MNFKCQKLTSFDTRVTHFIGQNVIREIPLFGKSAFELVHLCKGLLLVPFVQMAVLTFLKKKTFLTTRFTIDRVTSLRLIVL